MPGFPKMAAILSYFWFSLMQVKLTDVATVTIKLDIKSPGSPVPLPPSPLYFYVGSPFLLQHSQFILAWNRHKINYELQTKIKQNKAAIHGYLLKSHHSRYTLWYLGQSPGSYVCLGVDFAKQHQHTSPCSSF